MAEEPDEKRGVSMKEPRKNPFFLIIVCMMLMMLSQTVVSFAIVLLNGGSLFQSGMTMEQAMQGHSSLLRLYALLSGMHLTGCVARLFARREQALTRRLASTRPHLGLFFVYKLGYYCKIKERGV